MSGMFLWPLAKYLEAPEGGMLTILRFLLTGQQQAKTQAAQ
jgi:hypothetical protein